LEAVRRWYSQPGAGAKAKDRVREILKTIRELERNPVVWPRGDEPGTREVVAEGHTIVYRVEPDTGDRRSAGDVFVARIFGPGQDRR
jgi:plasmid stabilization system protein ParE